MAKRFMFVCFGILALAGAYAVGARNSVAQGSSPTFTGITGNSSCMAAITADGDIYFIGDYATDMPDAPHVRWARRGKQWVFMGNVVGGVVNTQSNSLGGVKTLFR
jgi:hypothetical protein